MMIMKKKKRNHFSLCSANEIQTSKKEFITVHQTKETMCTMKKKKEEEEIMSCAISIV